MVRLISMFSSTALLLMVPVTAEAACTFLKPLGAEGSVVKKLVQHPKGLIGNTFDCTN